MPGAAAGTEEGGGGGGGGGGGSDAEDARRKRQRTAEQSRASREKRRRELEQLRVANRQLKDEREGFRAKIKQLESQLANNLSSETVDMIRENSALKLQLQLHERFIQTFMKIASGPSSFAGQRVLCREGADAAQSYARALVAESLKSWKPLRLPAPYVFPIEDFQLHHSVTENFFGARPGVIGDPRRLNLRLDMSFPGVAKEEVAEYYWKTYQSAEEMDRLLSFKALELETVDVPDEDTVVMYNRKTWNSPHCKPTDVSFKANDEDAVFIINRQEEWLPRSTLRPPVDPSAEVPPPPGGQTAVDLFVGKAKATVVAMTSTRSTHEAMRSYKTALAQRGGGTDGDVDADPVAPLDSHNGHQADQNHERNGASAAADGAAGAAAKPAKADTEQEENADTGAAKASAASTPAVQHITSVIAQGAVAWYDDRAERSRLIVVLSYPQNFRWLDHTFADVVRDGAVTGEGFAQLLVHIGTRLQTVFNAQMAGRNTARKVTPEPSDHAAISS